MLFDCKTPTTTPKVPPVSRATKGLGRTISAVAAATTPDAPISMRLERVVSVLCMRTLSFQHHPSTTGLSCERRHRSGRAADRQLQSIVIPLVFSHGGFLPLRARP